MDISKIRNIMAEEGIIFSFSGIISQSIAEFMVETVSRQFEKQGHEKTTIRSMFLIAIEQLQNIMSYSKEKIVSSSNIYISPGILVVGFDEKKQKYYVSSSNEVNSEDEKKITKKVNLINSMAKDEQRKYLRDKLKTAEDTHSRGAGVGLIEMAKRSSEKLEYSFENIDKKRYFHILVYI